jgi:hypothetical protein
VKFDEEKEKLQQEKGHLIAEKLQVKEVVNRALCSVIVLEIKAEN